MISAPRPVNEAARLRLLTELDLLDTPPDPVLDGLVRCAAGVIGCPISLVVLVDGERQWFKAKLGIDFPETPRDGAFCAHAILHDELFVVPDAHADPRFADNPLVTGEPRVRFYAGAPLTVEGHRIGTLCVVDHQPRELSEVQRRLLIDLARAVEQWMLSWRGRQQLRTSETYRRRLFEQLGDGVLLIDGDCRILDANPRALGMFGYSANEMARLSLSQLLADFKRLRHDLLMPESTESASRLFECEPVRKDESRFAAEINVRPLDTARHIVVLRDIGARRAQEVELRKLSMAVQQSTEGIVITDLAANIEYINDAAVANSGYTREELIGRNSRHLLSGTPGADSYRTIWTQLTAGRPWKGLLYNRRKDGSEYIEFAVVTPVRMPDGRLTHYLAVKQDVTEKRRMGEELERHRNHLEELVAQRTAQLATAKQAAEAANESKSAFLATISHEIRTPMNGVMGIVDVLRQSSLTPYQAELADTIRESSVALMSIIDDILDFSKIEAGRLVLEHESVELERLVEAVCDGLQSSAGNRGVALRVFVEPSLPARIVGDAVRLRQILNNLIGNAIKFSAGLDRPGRVHVRIERSASGQLRMQVSDNGIGMSTEVQKSIFKPFVQGETDSTRRFGGTGLGLSICRRLADLLGGQIEVRSSPDHGARFTVVLPMQACTAEDHAPAQPDLSGLACHLVLDEPQRAHDWARYLAAAGATTRVWLDLAALHANQAAHRADAAVAIIETDESETAFGTLDPADTALLMAQVHIGAGQRRSARLLAPGRVQLDGDLVHRASLLTAVALASGRARPAPEGLSDGLAVGMATMPTTEEAASQGRLVLVAEDNEINQKVIARQLALYGIAAELAGDGLEALQRWRNALPQQRYGLLLTDLHMPGIDGYRLSSTIRDEEPAGQRMPIVALTANSMRGEADRCRAAGMDDYLSKPLRLAQLGAVLSRWLPRGPASPEGVDGGVDEAGAGPHLPGHPVLDSSVLASMIGADPEMLDKIRRVYVDSARSTAEEIRAAVALADIGTVGALAHRLKSSSRAVGALALGECCEQLERAASAGDSSAIEPLWRRFETALVMTLAKLGSGSAQPAGPAYVPTVQEATLPSPAAGVLLVDDEPFQLQVLQRQLAVLGVAPVTTSRSGAIALTWLQGRDTSALLLLVDLNMPGMDGVEFMRQLADQKFAGALALVSGADTRVLETATKLARAYQLNVLSHLHKPVSTEALRLLIESWRQFIPKRIAALTKAYAPGDVKRAIDAGELKLHYQPKVTLEDGAWVGVEALVRWQHPIDGMVAPDSFIAVAEAHGLINSLTRNVLAQALAQARRWRDQGLALQTAVNISMDNLVRLDFPEFVLSEVTRHGVSPTDLVLEVTESRLTRDARVPMDILTRLRLKQIGLSIDDFGTGHSSLAQLRDIPFHELKIDRGFVHGGHENGTQRAIFSASLEMAHQLDMKAVAEGVEDRADWDFVRAAGCDLAQGYFIAAPMQAEELPRWAAQWRTRFAGL